MPAECEADASPEEPMLLVAIDVDPTMLGEMMLEMDEPLPPAGATPRGISDDPDERGTGRGRHRLLECLKSPLDSRMLGRQTVREIVYRVLLGEQGGALRALASRDDHFARIARVLKHIHVEYAKPLSVEELARQAGMSVAAFHHYFKLVTASSPLQYLKRIRLDQAKRLMAHDGYNAGTAARAVGYESPSQFSREFKRLFGVTPVEEAEQTRARLVASSKPWGTEPPRRQNVLRPLAGGGGYRVDGKQFLVVQGVPDSLLECRPAEVHGQDAAVGSDQKRGWDRPDEIRFGHAFEHLSAVHLSPVQRVRLGVLRGSLRRPRRTTRRRARTGDLRRKSPGCPSSRASRRGKAAHHVAQKSSRTSLPRVLAHLERAAVEPWCREVGGRGRRRAHKA